MNPDCMYIGGLPGRITVIEGNSYLFFSGFAYLGMPSLRGFQDNVKEGVSKYGTVFPSSRGSNTRHHLYETFEEALSAWIGCPATASFSSGYLAALATIQYFSGNRKLYGLKGLHPSLCTRNLHAMKDTDAIVHAVNASKEDCAVVLESVNPLRGEVADLDWLSAIKKPIDVIIDDSHGLGILGKEGEGIQALLPQAGHLRYTICYSLSKAFSCEGGAVSGRKEDIAEIKKRPPFTASAPMSPAYVYAWIKSQSLFRQQREMLQKRILLLSHGLKDHEGIFFDGRVPVCFLPGKGVYERALDQYILLSAFKYPTSEDPLMTRAVINALHTKEDLNRLAHGIKEKFLS